MNHRESIIFNGAANGILTVDASGTVLDINPAGLRMFGLGEFDLVGRSIEAVIPSAGALIAAGTKPCEKEFFSASKAIAEGRRNTGETFPLELSLSSVKADGKVTFVGILHDITDRHAADAKVDRVTADLERSNAEIEKFAYIASHDLKAPLRVIDNASRWLEEDLAPHLTDDTKETMHLLRGRVHRMEQLLDDLLAYCRIGRATLPIRQITGEELMDEVLQLTNVHDGFSIERQGDFKNIRIPSMPLKMILLNLITNALKHHDGTEGNISVSISASAENYIFRVADDGPGIAPEYQTKIFEMFQTLRPRDEVEGSGLGLAMVKKYVALAGGTITVESDGVRGTAVQFSWPRQQDNADTPGVAA
ncbi:ATP-binding protein [Acuticoccus sp. MNP-M23]|uniref:PAS domain-containing sensor histidine kinase n=1 Tax=Acuticoccus sp. MNP-M23 TaxID=3072793 RepID=UPI002815C2E3|nr:ATP-binding protein [Acuticoccus sp. MNP-M23]WMS42783.1 ATP-binding protein [Acuticoccus sp. MNP-M23]